MFQDDAFFFAKGLDPCLPATWVPRHCRNDQKRMQKRARPVDWIIANMDAKGHVWFYFDIIYTLIYFSLKLGGKCTGNTPNVIKAGNKDVRKKGNRGASCELCNR